MLGENFDLDCVKALQRAYEAEETCRNNIATLEKLQGGEGERLLDTIRQTPIFDCMYLSGLAWKGFELEVWLDCVPSDFYEAARAVTERCKLSGKDGWIGGPVYRANWEGLTIFIMCKHYSYRDPLALD